MYGRMSNNLKISLLSVRRVKRQHEDIGNL
jgi:hypothetical protein